MFEDIFANRLRSARVMAGLSLDQLAELIGRRVTRQALQKYEKGLMKPDSSVLIALSKALNVKTDYFFRKNNIPVSEFEFRKRSRLSAKDEKAIKEAAKDYLERYLELEYLLGNDVKYSIPIKNGRIRCAEDAENAALELRKAWNLGLDAIPNLIETLEDNDLKVCQAVADASFDGLAACRDDISIIIINKNVSDVPRRRFTIAHELAHLFFEIMAVSDKEKENLCHRFAGAFLIPKEVMFREFGRKRGNFSLQELTELKKEYGISLKAIIRRAFELEIITASKYKSVCIEFSKRGWNANEPGEYRGEEEPKRFQRLLYRALAEGLVTVSKAAALGNSTIEEINAEASPIL